ncbi:MAG TPA: SMP-30/gluconolactonase/LRE family protein [Mycobacteriales bacterium]|nr:SMP-30/gluconolactonase/LRE family protein [Mycobacteriales bacterium]
MASVQVVVHRPAQLAEGPLWDEERGCLWWVDIPAGVLHRFDPADRKDTEETVGVEVGAVALRRDGGLLMAAGKGFATYDDGSLNWIGKVELGNRMNDGKCDPAGRFLAGTLVSEEESGRAGFYRLENGKVSLVFDGVTVSNGLGWSPAGDIMYYIDTPARRVDAFDYEVASGRLRNRRTFVDLSQVPGAPDGLTVDAKGAVWVAMSRGGAAIRRFLANGMPDQMVAMPVPNVTSLTFGGADLDELYVTTSRQGLGEKVAAAYPLAGCVFRVRGLRVPGLPSHRYAG